MEPDNARREIKGRNQNIRISERYSERKVKPEGDKEYVLVNASKKQSDKASAYGNTECVPKSAGDFSPAKGIRDSSDAEKIAAWGVSKAKQGAKFTVKSLKKEIKDISSKTNELAEPEDFNGNQKKILNKASAVVTFIAGKIAGLALSVAGSFISLLGVTGLLVISICLIVIISVKNVTYDFIVDEEKYLRETVSQINSEFVNEMEEMAAAAGCEQIIVSGQLTPWKDIIAFWWSFRSRMGDTEQWEGFFSGNDYEDLKQLFYEFNHVTSQVENKDSRTYLHVVITNTTMDEMIEDYGFDHEQKKYLTALLAADEVWDELLYSDELSVYAASETGQSRNKYMDWYPVADGERWNMAFIMYCLNEGGYLVPGCVTKTNNVNEFMNELLKRGWMSFINGSAGDIIFLSMSGVIKTGIITKTDDGAYYVIMGEYADSDVVCEVAVAKGSGMIKGFGKIEAFSLRLGTTSADVVTAGQLIWPASGQYYVTSCYKWRWGKQHQGIDIGCPEGTPILAVSDGTVIISQYSDSAGNYVMIDHGIYKTVYMHNSKLNVMAGEKVSAGQVIALSGNTGNSTGPHCHFGIMVNGAYTDPAPYLGLPSEWEGDASVYINQNKENNQETDAKPEG